MTVDQCYNIMRFIARKNQLTSLSPSDFQYSFNTAQRNYYDFLVGRVEQYRYDKPTPRVGLSMNENVVSRLTPFKKDSAITITSGTAPKPADFSKLLSMVTTGLFNVYRVEDDRFSNKYNDSIDVSSAEKNAFYVEDSTSWRIYPATLTSVSIKYLTLPVDVIWDYTTDVSGRPVYKPVGSGSLSVNPVWKDNDIDEIIGRACKILGVSIKENALINYGEQIIQKGE